jgi:hypothetical protein
MSGEEGAGTKECATGEEPRPFAWKAKILTSGALQAFRWKIELKRTSYLLDSSFIHAGHRLNKQTYGRLVDVEGTNEPA